MIAVLHAYVLAANLAGASIVVVPDQASTIQAGLALGTDTVLVRPGSYDEVVLLYRPVVISGIGLDSLSRPQLSGLTINPYVRAGGLYLIRSFICAGPVVIDNDYARAFPDVRFEQCAFQGGVAETSTFTDLATISVSRCTANGSLSLKARLSCEVDSSNVTNGGISGSDVLRVYDCLVEGGGDSGGIGGGSVSADIERNVVHNCSIGIASYTDGECTVKGNVVEGCSYAGIDVRPHAAALIGNVVRHCQNGVNAIADGGLTMIDNVIAGCVSRGAVISGLESGATITGNVIYDCGDDGVNLVGMISNVFSMKNNTFANNGGAGVVCWIVSVAEGGSVEVTNNIGYHNGAYGINWGTAENATSVRCNDWYGNVPADVGSGPPSPDDLSMEPLFCDPSSGDYHLLSTSPLADCPNCGQIGVLGVGCAATATVVTRFTASRIEDGVRIVWELSPFATVSDLWLERGANEAGPWQRLSNTQSRDGLGTVEVDRSALPDHDYWYRLSGMENGRSRVIASPIHVEGEAITFCIRWVGPNPTVGPVRIEFGLRSAAPVGIDVFDIQGRLVASPINGILAAGDHTVNWDGRSGGREASAGTYVLRYRYPGGEDRRRIVRLP